MWRQAPFKVRARYAKDGYCPWISGKGRVFPWVPKHLNSEPDFGEVKACALQSRLSYDAAAVRSLLLTSRRLPSIDKHTGRVRVRHDRGELEPDGACPNPPNPPPSPNTTTIIINSIHITVTITRLRHCKVISSYDHSHNRNTLPIATLRNTIRREWTARRQDGGRHSDTTL